MVQHTPANNLTILSMARGFSKYALTYMIPYLTADDVRSGEKTSYSMDSCLFEGSDELVWKLLKLRSTKLLNVAQRRRLIKKQEKSNCGIGTVNGCENYTDIVSGVGFSYRSPLYHVKEAMKVRAMRELRGFHKRKWGTAPTILGVQLERPLVESTSNIFDAPPPSNASCEVSPTAVLIFKSSTGDEPFNILQIKKDYQFSTVKRNTIIQGEFLECVGEDEFGVKYKMNPEWSKSYSGMSYSYVLRDESNGLITVSFADQVVEDSCVIHILEKKVYDDLSEISHEFEVSLHAVAETENENEELEESSENESGAEDEDDSNLPVERFSRKGRGNRLPTVYF